MSSKRAALEQLITADGIERIFPAMLLPADPYLDLAGEEFGRRLLLSLGNDGAEYCLRPDFTLPMAEAYLKDKNGPAALSYMGQVFRQRKEGPAEFEQAGLELIDQPDPECALDQVFQFASDALSIFDIAAPVVHLGSVGMFEALLSAVDIPDVWRPRIRHRFGQPESIGPLLTRLADPHGTSRDVVPAERDALVEEVSQRMVEAGLSLNGRTAEEIADRFIEKQALAATSVPAETLEILTSYLSISGDVDQALVQVKKLVQTPTDKFSATLDVITEHARALRNKMPSASVIFDAGFSPRLDYYTGVVFEMTTQDGSVLASGGQYSRLLQKLGADRKIPAAGCAVWVGRLEREAKQ